MLEIYILIIGILSIICVCIYFGYIMYQFDKPYRDWYNGNIPKNIHCKTYEDYLLYLE